MLSDIANFGRNRPLYTGVNLQQNTRLKSTIPDFICWIDRARFNVPSNTL